MGTARNARGRRSWARLWIAGISAAVVVAVVVADLGRKKSPGELAQVHGRESDLNGRWDCSNCHGGWRHTMNEACLECHKPIAAQIEKGAGLHGVVGAAKSKPCAACHSEHHGADFKMVNARSFAASGVADEKKFDHQVVGYRLDGKHGELECAKCHKSIDVAVPKPEEQRYGGLDRACTLCHKDPHEGRMFLGCADCHDQVDWKHFAYVDHDRFLALVGPHAGKQCRDCHAKGDPRSLETAGRDRRRAPRDCADCHQSQHAEKFVAGVAALAKTTPGATCARCHLPDHLTFNDTRIVVTAADHAASGFPIDAPHDKVDCFGCHSQKLPTFKERYPGRAADACATCHADPHGGQFKSGPFASGCLACHDRRRWTPHTFTVESHQLAALELTGRHVKADCNDCHKVAKKGAPRTYRGIPNDCDHCHSDAHAGFFAAAVAGRKRVAHGECARCHDTESFSDLPKEGFDHLAFTRFALDAAHAEAKCESCHARSEKPDRMRRSFGRVEQRYGRLKGCVTCHADPHGGAFDKAELPALVDGRTECARCHDATSFRDIVGEYDHGQWTGLALLDGHGKIGCAACHPPRARPDAKGRTFERAAGPGCADCHADPHGGQFLRDGKNECERCHHSAADFSVLVFKHNLQSRYKLDETHAAVACAACHKPVGPKDAAIVRYRPLGIECADCHEAPSDPLRPKTLRPKQAGQK